MPFIDELKIHKNKPLQRFSCEVLDRGTGSLILRYCSGAEGMISDIVIPKGATTIAFYWQERGYVLWRMYAAEGALFGSLFHICKDTTITDTRVSYVDLILDIWVAPDGTIRVLDEDELEHSCIAGQITQDEAVRIQQQKDGIISTCHEILAEAIRHETRLALQSPLTLQHTRRPANTQPCESLAVSRNL